MWRQVMSGEAGNLLRRQVRSLRLGSPLQSKFGVLSSLRFPGGLDSVSGCQSKVGYSSSSKEAVEEGLLIDTLEVMRGFERSGMKRAEADELTRHITKLILQTSNQFSAKFASQAYLEKLSGQLGDEMKGFKSEILKTQELQLDSLQKEIEGAKDELSKLRTEIRYGEWKT
uniref:Uncharacterized protein n=1 Tax=Chloropicon primus TaxID=1764295 RepID=A0A7S2SYX3_9CHLO|mmetsp:Transcript_12268/g.34147  ORF Transcript_12268/g.34147 Transcript_12268/m.34147 type:complete len:171 (+) Transcript_12268:276-788(+)